MNTLSEETLRVRNSSGSSAGSFCGKKRQHCIDITSSGKSSGEEVNSKNHEHVKSAIPRKFKRTTVVDNKRVAKTVILVEKKKTTTAAKVNPSADPKIPKPVEPVEVTTKDDALPSKKTQVMKRSLSTNGKAMRNEAAKNDVMLPSQKTQVMKQSLSTNGKAVRNEPKMFQRSTSLVKPSPVTVNRDASAGSNNVIKEIVSRLAESRKSKVKALVNAFETVISTSKLAESRKSSKVKALVDAFETVISLQDGKPSST